MAQVQYVKDILNDVASNYTIDSTRRYACGKSNGGGFTAMLACRPDTSLLFAAFAPVSPALYPGTFAFSGCNPSRPVPILHSHGIEDTITPFHGRGAMDVGFGPEPDVRDWRADWAERNGCTKDQVSNSSVSYPHDNTTEEVWECLTPVRALTMEGLGHAWPTTEGLDRAGAPNETATFNFTSSHLVQFFTDNPLPVKYLE